MSSLVFAAFVFICIFVASLAGFQLQRALPRNFTDDATEGNVRSVLGMLSMLTAVVLGFVTTDAKKSFDHASEIVADTAVRMVSIDRILADFGDDGARLRADLRRCAKSWIERIQSPAGDTHSDLRTIQKAEELEAFVEGIQRLKSSTTSQSEQQGRAVELSLGVLHDRWALKTEHSASTPTVFLIILLAWLAIEFLIFGLFATPNAPVLIATFLGAIMVASAFFLVLELEGPMTGSMRISTGALERALAIMGQ